jgi:hypothetical protein
MKSFALPVLAVFLLAGVLAAAPDFTGSWAGKTEISGVGTDDLSLVIQKKEDAQTKTVVYAATLADTLGYIAPGTEAREIKVEGGEMSFQFYIVNGTLISCKLTLKDDAMVGVWLDAASGESAEMKFERKK